jgi:hypothetical protein
MPITVQCSCGKRVGVADALIGKNIRCPKCGEPIAVRAPAAAPVTGKSAPAKKIKQAAAAMPSVSINYGQVALIVCVLLIVAVALAAYFGPVKVWHQWEDLGSDAQTQVNDVVSFGLQAYLSQNHMYNPRLETHRPEVDGVVGFFRPFLVMSMPDKVKFFGRTTQGPFEGYYHPQTHEIEATISYGATSRLSFGGNGPSMDEKTAGSFQITGRDNNGNPEAELDGQKLTIYYPPKEEGDQ